jgi:hypothetical protein
VKDEIVGAVVASGAERPRDRRRDPTTHAAVCRLQNQHHPRKGKRRTGQRVGSDPPEKKAIEGDHTRERKQVEDIRRCQAQERGQNRALKHKLGARRRGGRKAFCGWR